MADSVFPVSGDTATKAILRAWMQDGAIGDYIQSGFVMSDGGGLNVSVSAGVAMAQGVRLSTTAAITGALTASSTNHVFLTLDENVDDDVILTINTSGTAPSTPYLKLGTVVTGAGSVTTITPLLRSSIRDAFADMDYDYASAFRASFPIYFVKGIIGGAAAMPRVNGACVSLVNATSALNYFNGPLLTGGDASATSDSAVDLSTGDIIEFVGKFAFHNFSSLGANLIQGIEFTVGIAAPKGDKTTTTIRRINLGVDSAGGLYCVTSDGSAVTSTSLGVTVTSGQKVKIKFKWTVGTNLIVTVNDNGSPTTITGTLPSRVAAVYLQTNTGGTTNRVDYYGGAYRVTSA